ncbi:MAG: hypothetical protein LUG98_11085 [Tannerellaceae bacterium]|nr:hypothetical protein [Tannerellaceae bacterium]
MTIDQLEKLADQLSQKEDEGKRWMADAIRNRIKNNDPRVQQLLNYRNSEELIRSMGEQFDELNDDDHYKDDDYR